MAADGAADGAARSLRRRIAAADDPDRTDPRDCPVFRSLSRREMFRLLAEMRCYPGAKSRKARLFSILRSKFRLLEYGEAHAHAVRRIQRFARRVARRADAHRRGPALRNRAVCANRVDLLTTAPVDSIPDTDFMSVTDTSSGVVHGFDTETLARCLAQYGARNPYTRQAFPAHVAEDCRVLVARHSRFGTPAFRCPRGTVPGRARQGLRSRSFQDGAMRRTQTLRRRAYRLFDAVRREHAPDFGRASAEWLLVLSAQRSIDLYEGLRRDVRAMSRALRRRLLPGAPLRRVFPRSGGWYRRRYGSDGGAVAFQSRVLLPAIELITSTASTRAMRLVGAKCVFRSLAATSHVCRQALEAGNDG